MRYPPPGHQRRWGGILLNDSLKIFGVVLHRDLTLAYRRRSDVLTTLFFFIIVVSLFPFGVGPETNQLRLMAPGILWVAALLASMLSLGRLFSFDYLDGTLEQMLLGAAPLGLLVLAKVLAHWLVSGLPIVFMAPILGVMFDLPAEQLLVLTLSLLCGTPVLSLIGAVGAALTLGLRGGGVLVSLLVLPLYVPVLIFGAGAVGAQAAGIGAQSHLYLLAAFLAVSLLFAPWATAAGLRISAE